VLLSGALFSQGTAYVVHKINPERVTLSGGLWKIVSFSFEADGSEHQDEPPATE
jgi:hypothetical protein